MKIALVSAHVNSWSGVPKYVSSLARALVKNHQVTIFSATFAGLEGTGVHHHRVRAFGTGGIIHDLTFFLAGTALLGRVHLNRNAGFDIVHSHHYASPFFCDVVTSHYCEQIGIERMRLEKFGVPNLSCSQKLRSLAMARIEKMLFGRRTGCPLIVLSERMKRDFLRCYDIPDERFFVVYSGVDSERYTPANVSCFREEVRNQHSLALDDFVVLFVGGDWERKGLSQAIEAVSRIGSSRAKLLVVGPGDVASYRRLAKDRGVGNRVVFAGPTSEVWRYYATADVYLLPTHYEAFGLSILEAMASGLPVLVSRDAGAAELIRNGVDGLLIRDSMDVKEIATQLESLLKNFNLRRRLGEGARRIALQYNWDRVACRITEVYERVLAHKRTDLTGSVGHQRKE